MSDKPDEDGRERDTPGLLLRIAIGAVVGVPAFAFVGTLVGCYWLWPESNLCGLLPILYAIPIGAPIGGCIGALTMLVPKWR